MRWSVALLIVTMACARGPLLPVAIDTAHDACENCRMVVSDTRFAAEIVAPGEEPRFFDDIGCLQAWRQSHALAQGAIVFVTDHRTGAWIEASRATYTRVNDAATPMGSRLVAEARP